MGLYETAMRSLTEQGLHVFEAGGVYKVVPLETGIVTVEPVTDPSTPITFAATSGTARPLAQPGECVDDGWFDQSRMHVFDDGADECRCGKWAADDDDL